MSHAFRRLIVAGTFTIATLAVSSAQAAEVKWSRYMNSAPAVSTIAAAIALVSPCKKPLQFEETVNQNEIQLTVSCNSGDEDEEFAAIITFNIYGDAIVPSRIDQAG